MAKGKSNPKTLEHVKRMTKQMRSEQAEAQALEAATQAAQAVDRKRSKNKKGRRGDVSSDDDENDDPSATQAAAAANGGKKGTGSQSKVQVAGFGIGCRGTGNEKARKLKEEHDEKIRRKKAAKKAAVDETRHNPDRANHLAEDDDELSWRVRNQTVNKKANRKKKKGGRVDDDDDDDEDEVTLGSTLAARPDGAGDADEDGPEDIDGGEESGGGGGGGGVNMRALLMGDDDDDDDDEEEEDDNDEEEEQRRSESASAKLLDDLLPDVSELRIVEHAEEEVLVEDVDENDEDEEDEEDDDELGPLPGEDEDTALGDSENDSDWETDEDDDENAPFEPRPCESLFDGAELDTVHDNVEYMRRTHGFVFPYRGNLKDPEGIIGYLQRKIYRGRQCVFCGRKFGSLEGVRGHMRDKGHAKIRFEPPEVFKASVAAARGLTPEEIEDMNYVPEYSEFYDFSENSQALVDAAAFETFDKGGLELVLKSGKQLGHRSYRRYYRQKFRNDYVAKGSKSDERRAGAVAVATRVARKETQRKHNEIAVRSMRLAKAGASKALAAQYGTKAQFADNKARRAIVHHWGAGGGGSHYHTAGSKQFQKGVRIKGVISRHSKQGAKMQAARVQKARNKANRGTASVAVLRSGTRKG